MNCETALIASQFISANSDSLGEKTYSLQSDSERSLGVPAGRCSLRQLPSMVPNLASEGHDTTCYRSDAVSITKRYFTSLLSVRSCVSLNLSIAISSISPRIERVWANCLDADEE